MARESNRIVVGDTVINLDHVLYVVRAARGVILYFDTPILGNRDLVGRGQKPYELCLKGKAGQQFWQSYLSGTRRTELSEVPRLAAHTE
jgi:hypothetical protein